jgi:hypothetical protein
MAKESPAMNVSANANQLPNQASLTLVWQPTSRQQPGNAHYVAKMKKRKSPTKRKATAIRPTYFSSFSIVFCEVVD